VGGSLGREFLPQPQALYLYPRRGRRVLRPGPQPLGRDLACDDRPHSCGSIPRRR